MCGEDASPHDTNPDSRNQMIQQTALLLPNHQHQMGGTGGGGLRSSWCSTSIANASCVPAFHGQDIQCYKELWTVDGTECA